MAAHLEPEILIVDEVLPVDDAAFQKKCLGKLSEVAKSQSRTVLFVSHNMAAVENICRRGIVLQGGTVQCIGTQTEAVTRYLTAVSENSEPVGPQHWLGWKRGMPPQRKSFRHALIRSLLNERTSLHRYC